MFARLLEVVGLKRPDPMASLFKSINPRDFPGQVVSEGDPNHPHHFERVEWDRARLGADVTNFDEDHGTTLEFPMAMYKDLYRCSCGREIVRSVRALI